MDTAADSVTGLEDGLVEYRRVARFVEWRNKASALEEKMTVLEKEEGGFGKMYGSILEAVYAQTGFFILFTSCLVGLYVKNIAVYWMSLLVVSVLFAFAVGVVCPIAFAYRQMSGLKVIYQKLIHKRAKVYGSCLSLLGDYRMIYANEPQSGDNDLLMEVLDLHKVKLENFKREDPVPKFRKRFNRKFILAIGLCCFVYTILVLFYAVYIAEYQVVADPSLIPIPSPTPFGSLVFSPPTDDLAVLSRLESDLSLLPRKFLV